MIIKLLSILIFSLMHNMYCINNNNYYYFIIIIILLLVSLLFQSLS